MFSQSAQKGLVRVYTLHAWLQWYNIAPTLFPLLAAGVFQGKQTSRQLSRGLGLLWRTCRVASLFKRRDSALDLQTWSGSTYQFSLARQRQKPHATALGYPVSQYIIRERCSVGSVRARKNMLGFFSLFFFACTEAGNNRSAFNPADPSPCLHSDWTWTTLSFNPINPSWSCVPSLLRGLNQVLEMHLRHVQLT